MFYGNFKHVLDEKNRVAIPAPFREASIEKKYGKGFFITRGTEKCLFLFTPMHWEEFVSNIQKLAFTAERRMIERTFMGSAHKVECDPQGRMVIPQKLREYAGLERDIELTGVGRRIEVWSASKWESMDKENEMKYDVLIEKLLGGAAS
ncbi:MAG TPA: division/cell wall cluster transcriptional repressor MraZ [Candidatus Hypogeohydataceae bacterium YC41]